MKTSRLAFPVAFVLLSLLSHPLLAQNNSKSDEKRQQETEMKENKDAILKLVDARSFVIRANMLQDRHLNTYQVNPNINFIKIDSSEAVVQFALDGVIGWNGLGGLTVEGSYTDFRVSGQSGLDPITIITDLSTPDYGFMTLFITIFNNGSAHATITGSFGSRLTFMGDFNTLDGARVYQGQSRF